MQKRDKYYLSNFRNKYSIKCFKLGVITDKQTNKHNKDQHRNWKNNKKFHILYKLTEHAYFFM